MPPLSRVNFNHLRYLEALVEERNVTRAADRMGISQPAMSTALARLRTVLDDPLLVHTRNGMEPTPRAMDLARRSREISDILAGRGTSDDAFVLAESTMHWRIMASDGIARSFMPPLMKLVGQAAPNMRFTVHPGDPRRLHEYLRDGDFDLAIAFVRNPSPGLRQVIVLQQQLVCIARQGHPQIDSPLTLKQFLTESHVRWGGPPMGHATLESMIDETLESIGHARRISMQVSSLHVLPDVVAQSDLLAVVPEQLASAASALLPIQMLPLPFEVPQVEVSLTWHERLHQDPGHRWLRQSLLDIARTLRPQESLAPS